MSTCNLSQVLQVFWLKFPKFECHLLPCSSDSQLIKCTLCDSTDTDLAYIMS